MEILTPSRRTLASLALVLSLIGGLPPPLHGQAADEAHVKAAFLYNFAKFVEWPAQTFKNPTDPFKICVLGTSLVSRALNEIAGQKNVDGRPLSVTSVTDAGAASSCQILFVSAAAMPKARALLEELRPKSVLTVGETDGFAGSSGIVNFKVEDGRVRFEINPKTAEQARLQVSSRLLSLAQIVTVSR
jgi:hypothetical protein